MKYNGWTMAEIVDDREWQKRRKALVGCWKEHPGLNAFMLRSYVNGGPTDIFRWVRVRNYLTGSGFRTGQIKLSPDGQKLLAEARKFCEGKELPERYPVYDQPALPTREVECVG